jgi:hypothetical protein
MAPTAVDEVELAVDADRPAREESTSRGTLLMPSPPGTRSGRPTPHSVVSFPGPDGHDAVESSELLLCE